MGLILPHCELNQQLMGQSVAFVLEAAQSQLGHRASYWPCLFGQHTLHRHNEKGHLQISQELNEHFITTVILLQTHDNIEGR